MLKLPSLPAPIKEKASQGFELFWNLPFRLKSIFLFLAIFVLIVLLNYSYIMLFSTPTPIASPRLPLVERGEILDRNGKILALSTKVDNVTAWLPDVKDPAGSAQTLSPILGIPEAELLAKLKGTSNFVYLARKIAPHLSERIRSIQREGRLSGIALESDYARIYPEKDLASQTVGFVGVDNQGLAGIEYALNNILSPSATSTLDAFWLDNKPKAGNTVQLTIDSEIQYLLQKLSQEHFERNNPDNLFILLLKAKTAEIVSMLQLPSFNLNQYGEYDPAQWQNLPVTLTYEPGSVFKVFTLAVFLEDGKLSPNEFFNDNGLYEKVFPNGQKIQIKSIEAFGMVNAEGILRYSSNVGMAYASETVDNDLFYKKLLDFGFGAPVGIPMAGESTGILATPDKWSGRSKPTISFGQEIGTSALQIVQAATVLANKGLLFQPTLINKILSPSGEVLFENKPQAKRRVLTEKTAGQIMSMMQAAVERGSNWRNRIDGVNISSKTGTAQVAMPTGGYSTTDFMTSILSIFPTEDPEYILYIVFQHPQGSILGGQIAAPFSRDIIQFLIEKDSLAKKSQGEILYHPNEIPIKIPRPLTWDGATLPNLVGYSKRELYPLIQALSNRSIPFQMQGEGRVIDFNYPPTTPLEEIKELVIYLR